MISEERYLGFLDDRDVFVAFVIDDVDRDLAVRPRSKARRVPGAEAPGTSGPGCDTLGSFPRVVTYPSKLGRLDLNHRSPG
jgi:hypothetical protein